MKFRRAPAIQFHPACVAVAIWVLAPMVASAQEVGSTVISGVIDAGVRNTSLSPPAQAIVDVIEKMRLRSS